MRSQRITESTVIFIPISHCNNKFYVAPHRIIDPIFTNLKQAIFWWLLRVFKSKDISNSSHEPSIKKHTIKVLKIFCSNNFRKLLAISIWNRNIYNTKQSWNILYKYIYSILQANICSMPNLHKQLYKHYYNIIRLARLEQIQSAEKHYWFRTQNVRDRS